MQIKRMNRREFLVLAGATSGVALLAACQPKETPTAAPAEATEAPPAEPTEAPPPAEAVTIEFLGEPGTTDLRPEEQEKFQAENPNIEWVQVEQPEGASSL